MASSRPKLTVSLSPRALTELKSIYNYNAEHWGSARADRYEDFLLAGIAKLATSYDEGRDLEGFPALKSLTLRWSRSGDGHIVIYEVDRTAQTVDVLHIFHSKMDIPGRLRRD